MIEALEPWLRAKLEIISQKGKLAEAIRYALSRWEGLSRFLDDGRIERRRPTLGGAGFAGGNLQAQRRRAPGLPRRRAHPAGEPSPQQPHR